MSKKKTKVLVTYTFTVEYEHKEHLESIKRELEKRPMLDMCGAGKASNGECYGYSCRLSGKGQITSDATE